MNDNDLEWLGMLILLVCALSMLALFAYIGWRIFG